MVCICCVWRRRFFHKPTQYLPTNPLWRTKTTASMSQKVLQDLIYKSQRTRTSNLLVQPERSITGQFPKYKNESKFCFVFQWIRRQDQKAYYKKWWRDEQSRKDLNATKTSTHIFAGYWKLQKMPMCYWTFIFILYESKPLGRILG